MGDGTLFRRGPGSGPLLDRRQDDPCGHQDRDGPRRVGALRPAGQTQVDPGRNSRGIHTDILTFLVAVGSLYERQKYMEGSLFTKKKKKKGGGFFSKKKKKKKKKKS